MEPAGYEDFVLLMDRCTFCCAFLAECTYGDGLSAPRIRKILEAELG